MKPILLSAAVALLSICVQAQEAKKYSYLLVRIVPYSGKGDRYFVIEAEPGNKFAKEIYQLVTFKPGKYFLNQPAFYQARNDTNTVFYNCFVNTTEALNFLSEQKWELLSVTSEVSSSWSVYSGNPYTTVTSSPVYYFRKELE